MLTTVAVPRSARWCGGQCSVPATQATGSQTTGACAMVSLGLVWSKARMLGRGSRQAAVFPMGQAFDELDLISSSQ